ncbi:UNVERIFIED_CONTAM: hypothetical protein K2H54_059951 [Gekko kuhli]
MVLTRGVTSRSIVSNATTSPDVTSNPEAGDLAEEPVLDKFKPEFDSEGEDSTKPDGTLEDHDTETVSDIDKIETANLEESPLDSNGTRTNDESDEDDALALFSLLVKRAVDEEITDDSEEDESETSSVDEDKFSFSDLRQLFKPLIDAFTDQSSSEAPSKNDFLSWFPSLKDLFEPNKPGGTEATEATTRPGRRSSFSTASEPSLQGPPASVKPPEPEILTSSQPDALITTVPTVTGSPITIPKTPGPFSKHPVTINPADNSDSDEDSETDF